MSAPLVYGQLGGSSRIHVTDDGIHVTDETGVERVLVGHLGGGDYGLKVVNAGSTVIIDGSSDMFRITATGTIALTGGSGTASAAVGVGGPTDIATGMTYIPTVMAVLETAVNTATALPHTSIVGTDGSPSAGFDSGEWSDYVYLVAAVANTNQTRLSTNWWTRLNRSAVTYTFRYYILEQVAF